MAGNKLGLSMRQLGQPEDRVAVIYDMAMVPVMGSEIP